MFKSNMFLCATVLLVVQLSVWTNVSAGAPDNQPTADTESKVATWPQWRGPTRDGFVSPNGPWPESIDDEHLKESWRVELGPSYSGPIVAEDRVFATETKDRKFEIVRALDRATGRELWQAKWEGAMRVPFFAMSNGSWIRATPAYDGETLYVAGMRDVLVALDAKSGREQWKVDFVADFNKPLPSFGFVSSPLVDGDHLFVQAGAACRKLRKDTGEEVWSSLSDGGGMYGSAFSSPAIAEVAGRRQLLVQTRLKVAGVDPEQGDVLWSREIPAFRGMNILTPTVYGDSVFTSSYGGRSVLLKVTPDAGKLAAEETWSTTTQGYMSTPVVIGGHAYLHLRNQRFTCVDLQTGERTWTTKPYGRYWSLVANGDRILALDQRGELLLIRARPDEFDLIGQRKLSGGSTWAHLAVCGREVFIRELNAMTAYRWAD